jgi:predicted nicotinamide N-methyase
MDLKGERDTTFKVPLSSEEFVDVKIHVPAIRAQGLNLLPWASTYVLARQLHTLGVDPPQENGSNIPILELGAGIGLVGLVGSMLWHRPVFLTDLEPVTPGLTTNINLNARLLQHYGGSAIAGALDWNEPDTLTLPGNTSVSAKGTKANIIIAADTIYDEEHPAMLTQTILKWLAPGPDARVIIVYPLRIAYLDQIRELWERLEDAGLEAITEGKEEAVDVGNTSWDDERLCEWSVWKWKTD